MTTRTQHRAKRIKRPIPPIEIHRRKILLDSERYRGQIAALARDINAEPRTVQALFRGQFRSIGNLEPKAARALSVSPEYLGWPQDPDTIVDPNNVPKKDIWYRQGGGL